MAPAPGLGGVLFAFVYSVLATSGVVLMHLLGTWLDGFGSTLASLSSLAVRGLTTSIGMIWMYVSSTSLAVGLRPEQLGSWLHLRLLLMWALVLTFVGSAATLQLLQWREALTGDLDTDPEGGGSRSSSRNSSPTAARRSRGELGQASWSTVTQEPSVSAEDMRAIAAVAKAFGNGVGGDGGGGGGQGGGGGTDALPPTPYGYARLTDEDGDLGRGGRGGAAQAEAAAAHAPPSVAEEKRPPMRQLPTHARMVSVIAMPELLSPRSKRASTQLAQGGEGDGAGLLPAGDPSGAGGATSDHKHALHEHARAERVRRWVLAAGAQVLLVIEKVMSFVTAWAWTDVFFRHLSGGDRPSSWLVLRDTGVAISLSLAVVGWLVLIGGELHLNARLERSAVEMFFVANSASFFVGWSWVIVLRDMAAVPLFESLVAALTHQRVDQYWDALVSVTVTGPLVSVVILYAKSVALHDVIERATIAAPEAAVQEEASLATVQQRRRNMKRMRRLSHASMA